MGNFCYKKNIKLDKSKPNSFRHNFKNFNATHFDFKLKNTDWNATPEIDKKDIDLSFSKFLSNFNNLLSQYVPLKKLSNKEIKTLRNPGLQEEF